MRVVILGSGAVGCLFAALLDEVQAFYPASHLFWGLWGLHRSTDADACAEFDYRAYAEDRLRRVVLPS